MVFIPYLLNTKVFREDIFKGRRVIELGCGTGCVGLALAIIGADVVLTDRAPLEGLVTTNITTNKLESKAKFKALEWGEDVSSLGRFDAVIMSDIVAVTYSGAYPLLLKTLKDLTSPQTLILLAYERRDRKDLKFFEMLLDNGFKYQKVSESQLDEQWQDDDIGIFRIFRCE
uniref:Methyltransferase small domain-containing protein n=1 Tax=Arcella intermedia TaxID=1963864 RepID=A0A6B2LJP2_9EUKA